MPDQDAVLAITSGVGNMQEVLNVVWEELLPAMGASALPANSDTQHKLRERLSDLELKPPEGKRTSPMASIVSGKSLPV